MTGRIRIDHADCVKWLEQYDGPLFDSCVTDPPYELGFMGKGWDKSGVAFRPETWRAIYDRMKAGAHLVAFSGTRTYHRMAVAIEDAGFEIRDQLAWAYGTGFPKSHDVSKAIDKAAGAVREVVGFDETKARPNKENFAKRTDRKADGEAIEGWKDNGATITAPATDEAKKWDGWGTALKPAWEPICLARKPLDQSSIAANVMEHGTGAINIDACRVDFAGSADEAESKSKNRHADFGSGPRNNAIYNGDGRTRGENGNYDPVGRFPANLLHDGSDEVLAGFPDTETHGGGVRNSAAGIFGGLGSGGELRVSGPDSGSAARFFYSAKAGPLDRLGSQHATVKPVDLMRWLVRLITPPQGLILEPFAGSGTTGIACMAEGFACQMLELEAEHVEDIERKLAYLRGSGRSKFHEHDRVRSEPKPVEDLPLFGG